MGLLACLQLECLRASLQENDAKLKRRAEGEGLHAFAGGHVVERAPQLVRQTVA